MIPGGIADKLGNGYEAYWTVWNALRVIQGQAVAIKLEPFDEDADGFEFRLEENGIIQWHQCKRRRSGNWTIHSLASRGILADFAKKLQTPNTECVFVTSDPVVPFNSLTNKARHIEKIDQFLLALNEDEEKGFISTQEAWKVGPETAFGYLRRCRVEVTTDETIRRTALDFCSLMFQGEPQSVLDGLKGFLEDSLTHALSTDALRDKASSVLKLTWRGNLDPTLESSIAAATKSYVSTLRTTIAGVTIETPAPAAAVKILADKIKKFAIIAGAAGSGKSSAIAAIIKTAQASDIPVLAFRIDRLLQSNSLMELGHATVGRFENPVGILGNRYNDRQTLIIIDQVDAVSEASGRSSRVRDLFFDMIAATNHYPLMKVVVACRTYDLENDYNLSQLSSSEQSTTIKIEGLDWADSVVPILAKLGVAEASFSKQQKTILSLPINLYLFAEIIKAGESAPSELSTSRLTDRLIQIREKEFSQAGIAWSPSAALGAIADWMSDNQELSAPIAVLSSYLNAPAHLSSAGFISHESGKVQFTHESFFDNIFSSHFLAKKTSVAELLRSDEQRLFRRTQVRQIFTKLRDIGVDRKYISNLSEVMNSADIRYLVKDAIGAWMVAIESPSLQELKLVLQWFVPGHPLENVSRRVLSNTNWFSILDSTKLLEEWYAKSGDVKDFASWVLRNNAVSHSRRIAELLRNYWDNRSDRTDELLKWFKHLYANGPIGDLEQLYTDLITVASIDHFDADNLLAGLDLGSWTHTDVALGARLLGIWLHRWFELFPDQQPFKFMDLRQNDEHWLKEIVSKEPEAFLVSVLPSFARAIERDRKFVEEKAIYYSAFSLMASDDDLPNDFLSCVRIGLKQIAPSKPDLANRLLDLLPKDSVVSLHLQLETIASNGVLAERFTKLLTDPNLLEAGYNGIKWVSFAEAARACIPHLTRDWRDRIERIVAAYRPELDRLQKYLKEDREGIAEPRLFPTDRKYYIRLLNRSGQEQRGILRTIGAELLSATCKLKLAELERKFPNEPLPEAIQTKGGWVQSPIKPENAAKMSDAQWLRAMQRYDNEEQRFYGHDMVRGGSRELTSVLKEETKANPSRFLSLLETMPKTLNVSYPEGIIWGLQEAKIPAALALKAVRLVLTWPRPEADRMLCRLISQHPSLGLEDEILSFLFDVARNGSASDTAVTSSKSNTNKAPRVNELLNAPDDLEGSGLNSDRGAAYGALGSILWNSELRLEEILKFVEKAVTDEPLLSVRTQMFRVINAVSKYQPETGIDLLLAMGRQDLQSIRCRQAIHMLHWATFNYPHKVMPLINNLIASDHDRIRVIGLFSLSGVALADDLSAARFSKMWPDDLLARRVAAFRASANIGVDRFGERALEWLLPFFSDPDLQVRDEAANLNWEKILNGNTATIPLTQKYISSLIFEDHPSAVMRALGKAVDVYTELAVSAVDRVMQLLDKWKQDGNPDRSSATYGLSEILVKLYRNVQGNTEQEIKLLDIFDSYIARDIYDIRSAISDYERR
jgi:hypothetical protein